MKQKQQTNTGELGFHERLQQELSIYPMKTIQSDGSVTIHHVKDPYFLINDVWNIAFLENIPQFKKMVEDFNVKKNTKRNVHFEFNSPNVNLEAKYVFYQNLFNDKWTLTTLFISHSRYLRKLAIFLKEKYPSLHSILDLDIEKTEREWLFWLEQQGISTQKKIKNVWTYGKYTPIIYILRTIYSNLFALTDTREELDKDRWDVRILHDKYGINYVKSSTNYYIDFTKIEQVNMRQHVKRYISLRLLGKNNFSWSRATHYLKALPNFFSILFSLEPTWTDLKELKRYHIEQYIKWLNKHAKEISIKNAHPEYYILQTLSVIRKFLDDIQRYEYDIAPETDIRLLFFPEDRPKLRKKTLDQIDYIPDFVLEQLFKHINDLHKEVIPVIWIAFKTGLRISDVLGLTFDCLERLNSKYSIVTDIEKTYVQGHRIPIDDELANILAVLIKESKENSNKDNNPEEFIFVRYRGSRKGKPYTQYWVRLELNKLAYKKNIVDENGNLFHFTNHQFRHTYAVKMLNGGADILTVQELLAHASPEMTLRYAKLLDDTKRKAFESVINQGVFSFDLNGEVQEIKAGEDIPQDILQALWQDHKLNAMDNPYGTCHSRLKGNCPHMEAPPCLTCNGGSPCKDLAIGFSELDVEKYEMHVKTTSRAVEVAKQHGRDDMAERHERNLQRYQGILDNIREGHVVFGRQDRMKRKQGVKNG